MNSEMVKVATPENVELEFSLAGVGSRFYAGILDSIFMFFFIIAVVIIIGFFGGMENLLGQTNSTLSSIKGSLLILVLFAVQWGYYVFWETMSKGQSLGKKICRIQVLTDDGLFPSWKQAAIRNIMRIVDSFPGITYFIAAVVIGIDSKGKRLGDIAAGTIVVRKEKNQIKKRHALSARSMTLIEKGKSTQGLELPYGSIDSQTLALIDRFLQRRIKLTPAKRREIAVKIAEPLYKKWGERVDEPEQLLLKIHKLAIQEVSQIVNEEVTKEKLELWKNFEKQVTSLLGKKRRLKKLTADEIELLILSYRYIVADLARARSIKTDKGTVQFLNHLVILGHQLLHQKLEEDKESQDYLIFRFPKAIRKHLGPVILSATLFFAPAFIAYYAVLSNPELGYDLVPEQFIDFSPAQDDNIHEIPSIARPIAASEIMTNNIQVTFLAFALGLTAGWGTRYALI